MNQPSVQCEWAWWKEERGFYSQFYRLTPKFNQFINVWIFSIIIKPFLFLKYVIIVQIFNPWSYIKICFFFVAKQKACFNSTYCLKGIGWQRKILSFLIFFKKFLTRKGVSHQSVRQSWHTLMFKYVINHFIVLKY